MVFTANAVLMVAMMMAMSVQGCDLALMVLNAASVAAWSLLTEMGYQILQTGMMMMAFNVFVFILFNSTSGTTFTNKNSMTFAGEVLEWKTFKRDLKSR